MNTPLSKTNDYTFSRTINLPHTSHASPCPKRMKKKIRYWDLKIDWLFTYVRNFGRQYTQYTDIPPTVDRYAANSSL